MNKIKDRICIVLPVYKDSLEPYEQVSLHRLCKVLGSYPIVFVAPENLDLTVYEEITFKYNVSVSFQKFQSKFFRSISGYNRLLLTPAFYYRFQIYEFMLIYQLDCYVFEDKLTYWMDQNFDFVGAPWMDEQATYFKPGLNGGLSLRKIQSHIKVLKSFSYIFSLNEIREQKFYKESSFLLRIVRLIGAFTLKNNTYYLLNDFQSNEDHFFTNFAHRNFDWFEIPTSEKAMEFAFERGAVVLFEKNKKQLPFGCHAWQKYDVDFWKEYIT